EAIIALRFALGEKHSAPKVALALIDAACSEDRTLAQTALHTLGGLELSSEHTKKLEKLVNHPDVERARFVLEQLGRQGGADATRALVKALCSLDRRRAEIAAAALRENDGTSPAAPARGQHLDGTSPAPPARGQHLRDAAPLLAKALLDT